jgi:hypothetical protein
MVREGPPQPAPYPAEQMRRDRMLRRLPLRRGALIAALVLVVIVALLLAIWG